MRFLVIGLGSMGKRRVRNLKAMGYSDISGMDIRIDRRAEASSRYKIKVYDSFEVALNDFKPDVAIISTSPNCHLDYAWALVKYGIPVFIEASVTESKGIQKLALEARRVNVIVAPSCTMKFFPGPLIVKRTLNEGRIGRVHGFNYQTGQYLPDWHPWEDIADYYVSNKETGGCRELVPFELTWLNDIFGEPVPVSCVKRKLSNMNIDIDDIYYIIVSYPQAVFGNITIEVLSRPTPTRELRVIGSEGLLVYSADENCVRTKRLGETEWVREPLGSFEVEEGYINPEQPYIEELNAFIRAITTGNPMEFPNTLMSDAFVLETLYKLEGLAESTR